MVGCRAFLVWGGNCGLRVLDRSARPTPGLDDHLPRGWGIPILWLKDERDLPADVRRALDA